MVRLLRDETLVAKFKNFFENGYKSELETIAASYPDKKSIYVDYIQLDKYDEEFTYGESRTGLCKNGICQGSS